ncbi:hypothetical protein [Luteolibacter yonseiensis]|nr:hypothetical protein [Luteolibacter yonseiensis]
MNLPIEINQRVLNELASPQDRTAIRVICASVPNPSPYRLRGKRRQYVFERNNTIGAHILDIPASLWQHDIPRGPWRENLSLCHDMQTVMGVKVPLVFLIIPWGEGAQDTDTTAATGEGSQMLELLRNFFTKLDAPPIVFEGLECLAHRGPEAFSEFVQAISPPTDDIVEAASRTGEASQPSAPSSPAPNILATPVKRELSMDPAAVRMRKMRGRKSEAKKKAASKVAAKKTGRRKPEPARA